MSVFFKVFICNLLHLLKLDLLDLLFLLFKMILVFTKFLKLADGLKFCLSLPATVRLRRMAGQDLSLPHRTRGRLLLGGTSPRHAQVSTALISRLSGGSLLRTNHVNKDVKKTVRGRSPLTTS